jgi:hypothetical protein
LAALAGPGAAAAARKGRVDLFATERTYADGLAIQRSIKPSSGFIARAKCCFTAREIVDQADGVHGPGIIDRDPTPLERTFVNSRLLWIDGDALIVHPENPLCQKGASLGQVRQLLRSKLTGWTSLVPSWPASLPPAIEAFGPLMLSGEREVQFGIPVRTGAERAYGPTVQLVHERDAIAAVAQNPAAAASVAWSAARSAIAAGTVCAVAVGGVVPTELTLRDGSYPAVVHATLVYRSTDSRHAPTWTARARRFYVPYLFSLPVRRLLLTANDRRRLLP